jgi:beta-carotene 3-hydroxylase
VGFAAVAVLSFVAMEPFTYLSHRFVMHGVARCVHRSHHVASGHGWEANDAFPMAFAAVAMVATFAAYQGLASRWILPGIVGVALYGATYAMVHDLYIHRRLPLFRRRYAVLERLAEAHRIHHLFGGEPYGMLLPLVPSRLRARARSVF